MTPTPTQFLQIIVVVFALLILALGTLLLWKILTTEPTTREPLAVTLEAGEQLRKLHIEDDVIFIEIEQKDGTLRLLELKNDKLTPALSIRPAP